MKAKRKILAFIAGIFLISVMTTGCAQKGDQNVSGFEAPSLLKLVNGKYLKAIKDSWEFGSSTDPIAKVTATDLEVTGNLQADNVDIGTITISGQVEGDLEIPGTASGTRAEFLEADIGSSTIDDLNVSNFNSSATTTISDNSNIVVQGNGGVFKMLYSSLKTLLNAIYATLTGFTMAGNIAMGGNDITGIDEITVASTTISESLTMYNSKWVSGIDDDGSTLYGFKFASSSMIFGTDIAMGGGIDLGTNASGTIANLSITSDIADGVNVIQQITADNNPWIVFSAESDGAEGADHIFTGIATTSPVASLTVDGCIAHYYNGTYYWYNPLATDFSDFATTTKPGICE